MTATARPRQSLDWAKRRGVQRLRSNRQIGLPEKERVAEWSEMFESRRIVDASDVFAVLDAACAKADRAGEWRNWTYLTLQIQLAAEKLQVGEPVVPPIPDSLEIAEEDPGCEWARAKTMIRAEISEVAFANWFDATRQLERNGGELYVAVPNEPTRMYLMTQYAGVISRAIAPFGIEQIHTIVSSSIS